MATILTVWKRQFYFRNFGISYSQYRHFASYGKGVFLKGFQFPVPGIRRAGFGRNFTEFKYRQMSSVTSAGGGGEDDSSGMEMYSDELDDVAFDSTVETEEELSHLRVKLYQSEEDEKLREYLERIYECASIQSVIDVVEEYERNEKGFSVKLASQALVTVWDLQKFLFKVSASFDPQRDYVDRPSFIEKICQHSAFMEKVVNPLIENCELLEDEPLTAVFLCLKKLNYTVRGPECEKFTEECLRRQNSLSLPSISRLCVCLRNEGLYGSAVVAKFYPLLFKYLDSMSEDLDIRLVAISLRNSFRLVTDATMDRFRAKIDELKGDCSNWETVTLCKVFLLLMVGRQSGKDCHHVFDLIGEELTNRIPNMLIMDLLSLQKFLDQGYLQPYGLIEALVKRMLRIVQEGVSSSTKPRLDLLASISPFLKTFEQRRKISLMMQDYLHNQNFEFAHVILLTMLRWIRIKDTSMYDTFWNKATKMVQSKDDVDIFDRRVLKLAKDYVNFCYGMGLSYRHQEFETVVKSYLYRRIMDYEDGTPHTLFLPADYSKVFGFLIGIASFNEPIFCDPDLLKKLDKLSCQFRPSDLGVLARGVEVVLQTMINPKRPSSKYYDRVIEICSILEKHCTRLLEQTEELSFNDLITIQKVCILTRRVKGDSPILEACMEKIVQCEIHDGRAARDLAHVLLLGGNNYPVANDVLSDYILKTKSKLISPEIVEKFVVEAFNVGWESENSDSVMEICRENLSRNWDKLNYLHLLQASLGLCFYRHMPKELVHNIFSVEFLDQLDDELKLAHSGNQYPMKLRTAMMELNRAVCIDMPDINLPWFHGKFCEELIAIRSSQETYLHSEVHSALARIVGDEAAVQRNMCSPYFYTLDFLIEFDEKSRPIKKYRRQPSRFFQKFRQTQEQEQKVHRKVAVLLLNQFSFTRGVRALKGRFKLRHRHLEMLGYDVIEIDPVYWNSMFMSENVVKENFLESKLYANAAVG